MNINFDKTVICGPEYVALREIDSGKIGQTEAGFFISEEAAENNKLGFYKVQNVGEEARKNYGLKEDDYVMADRLASFYHTSPVCLMKYTNVIVKTNENRTEYKPLKNMIFVEEEKKEIKNSNGFYLQNDPNELRLGTIIDMNVDEKDFPNLPFKVGDKVMLVRGGDLVQFGQRMFFVFKPDQIICKVVENNV